MALLGELEGVRQKILEDLSKTLGIGEDAGRGVGSNFDRVAEAFLLSDVLELALESGLELTDRQVDRLDRDSARLGLGQIEDRVEEAK